MDAGTCRPAHEFLDNTLGGLALNLAPTFMAVLCADSGEQDAQVVGDFGNCADSRSRVS